MRSKGKLNCLACVVAVLLGVGPLAGQTVTGTLSGHVLDSSGAVVPSVKVTAKNDQTGGIREATTNEGGYYLVSFLPIGSYEVVVAVTGFRAKAMSLREVR